MFQWVDKVELCDAFCITFHVISILFASIPFLCRFLALATLTILSFFFLSAFHSAQSIQCLFSCDAHCCSLFLTQLRTKLQWHIQLNGSELCTIKLEIILVFCFWPSHIGILACVGLTVYIDVSFYGSHQAHKRFTNNNESILLLTSRVNDKHFFSHKFSNFLFHLILPCQFFSSRYVQYWCVFFYWSHSKTELVTIHNNTSSDPIH